MSKCKLTSQEKLLYKLNILQVHLHRLHSSEFVWYCLWHMLRCQKIHVACPGWRVHKILVERSLPKECLQSIRICKTFWWTKIVREKPAGFKIYVEMLYFSTTTLSFQIIRTQTKSVLSEVTFTEIEHSTLCTILSQVSKSPMFLLAKVKLFFLRRW